MEQQRRIFRSVPVDLHPKSLRPGEQIQSVAVCNYVPQNAAFAEALPSDNSSTVTDLGAPAASAAGASEAVATGREGVLCLGTTAGRLVAVAWPPPALPDWNGTRVPGAHQGQNQYSTVFRDGVSGDSPAQSGTPSLTSPASSALSSPGRSPPGSVTSHRSGEGSSHKSREGTTELGTRGGRGVNGLQQQQQHQQQQQQQVRQAEVQGECRLGKRPVEHTEGLEALGAVAGLCDGIVRLVQLDHLRYATAGSQMAPQQLQPGVPVGPPRGVLAFTSSRGRVERVYGDRPLAHRGERGDANSAHRSGRGDASPTVWTVREEGPEVARLRVPSDNEPDALNGDVGQSGGERNPTGAPQVLCDVSRGTGREHSAMVPEGLRASQYLVLALRKKLLVFLGHCEYPSGTPHQDIHDQRQPQHQSQHQQQENEHRQNSQQQQQQRQHRQQRLLRVEDVPALTVSLVCEIPLPPDMAGPNGETPLALAWLDRPDSTQGEEIGSRQVGTYTGASLDREGSRKESAGRAEAPERSRNQQGTGAQRFVSGEASRDLPQGVAGKSTPKIGIPKAAVVVATATRYLLVSVHQGSALQLFSFPENPLGRPIACPLTRPAQKPLPSHPSSQSVGSSHSSRIPGSSHEPQSARRQPTIGAGTGAEALPGSVERDAGRDSSSQRTDFAMPGPGPHGTWDWGEGRWGGESGIAEIARLLEEGEKQHATICHSLREGTHAQPHHPNSTVAGLEGYSIGRLGGPLTPGDTAREGREGGVSDEDLALVVTDNLGVIVDSQGHPVGNPVLFSSTPGSVTFTDPFLLSLSSPPTLNPSPSSPAAPAGTLAVYHRTSGTLLQTLTVTGTIAGTVTGTGTGAVTGTVTGTVTGRRGQGLNGEVGPSPSGPQSLSGGAIASHARHHSSAGDLTKSGGGSVFAKTGSAIFSSLTGSNAPSGVSTPTGMLTPTGGWGSTSGGLMNAAGFFAGIGGASLGPTAGDVPRVLSQGRALVVWDSQHHAQVAAPPVGAVAGESQVWCLERVSLADQAKQLLKEGLLEGALAVARETEAGEPGAQAVRRVGEVEAQVGLLLLVRYLEFEEGVAHLGYAGERECFSPAELFSLFPHLSARWRNLAPRRRYWGIHPPLSSLHDALGCCCFLGGNAPGAPPSSHSSSAPASAKHPSSTGSGVVKKGGGGEQGKPGKGGAQQGQARGVPPPPSAASLPGLRRRLQLCVCRYLLMVRQRRPGDVEGPSEEWRGLDTLLLRLLLECAPPELVLKFVSLPNNCLLDDVETSLKAKGHVEALAWLRERAGQRSAALDLLRQLAGTHSGPPPCVPGLHREGTPSLTLSVTASSARERAVRLSVRVLQGEKDPNVVLQHLVWVLNLDVGAGLAVLTDSKRDPPLPVDAVLAAVSESTSAREATWRYLKWVVMGSTQPGGSVSADGNKLSLQELHTRLAVALVEAVMAWCQSTGRKSPAHTPISAGASMNGSGSGSVSESDAPTSVPHSPFASADHPPLDDSPSTSSQASTAAPPWVSSQGWWEPPPGQEATAGTLRGAPLSAPQQQQQQEQRKEEVQASEAWWSLRAFVLSSPFYDAPRVYACTFRTTPQPSREEGYASGTPQQGLYQGWTAGTEQSLPEHHSGTPVATSLAAGEVTSGTPPLAREQVVLLNRMGNHRGALELLALVLGDHRAAEEYCKHVGGQGAFGTLLGLYLGAGIQPAGKAEGQPGRQPGGKDGGQPGGSRRERTDKGEGLGQSVSHSRKGKGPLRERKAEAGKRVKPLPSLGDFEPLPLMLGQAVRLFRCPSAFLDFERILNSIPKAAPLKGAAAECLMGLLQDRVHRRRECQLAVQLSKGANRHARLSLIRRQQVCITFGVTGRACDACGRRVGEDTRGRHSARNSFNSGGKSTSNGIGSGVGMGISMSRESNESGGSSLFESGSDQHEEVQGRNRFLERFAAGEALSDTEASALAGSEDFSTAGANTTGGAAPPAGTTGLRGVTAVSTGPAAQGGPLSQTKSNNGSSNQLTSPAFVVYPNGVVACSKCWRQSGPSKCPLTGVNFRSPKAPLYSKQLAP